MSYNSGHSNQLRTFLSSGFISRPASGSFAPPSRAAPRARFGIKIPAPPRTFSSPEPTERSVPRPFSPGNDTNGVLIPARYARSSFSGLPQQCCASTRREGDATGSLRGLKKLCR